MYKIFLCLTLGESLTTLNGKSYLVKQQFIFHELYIKWSLCWWNFILGSVWGIVHGFRWWCVHNDFHYTVLILFLIIGSFSLTFLRICIHIFCISSKNCFHMVTVINVWYFWKRDNIFRFWYYLSNDPLDNIMSRIFCFMEFTKPT